MSITTWTRIEPAIEYDDPLRGLDEGLAARLADPLWLLARQWQLGELRGEDAGSPVVARAAIASYPVDELILGGQPRPLPPGVPLEALVEPEPVIIDVRLRARGGELFSALLSDHGLAHLASAAREVLGWGDLHGDNSADLLAALAARRWPDGLAIAASIAASRLAADLHATAANAPALTLVTKAWQAWWDVRAGVGARDTWIPDRLEHTFAVRVQVAEGQLTLDAAGYPGGRVDWDDFAVATLQPGRPPSPQRRRIDALPTVLDVPGMPVVRFWELEDPRFDPGRLSLGPGDLGTALLLETALTYASDWFLIPAAVTVGALHKIEELTIVDTFGVVAVVRPVEQVRPDARWALWRLTHRGHNAPPYLFVPASTPATLTGELLEEVALVKDELANVVWAIERIVADDLDRGQRVIRQPAIASAPTSRADLVYRPLPPLPGDRIPLVRVDHPAGALLRRASTVDPSMSVPATTGRLLTADFTLRDDEIGREGLILTRRWQAATDTSGNRWIWRTRAKEPGAHQAGVRLGFDDLVPPKVDKR
jgi:hypothetical protein